MASECKGQTKSGEPCKGWCVGGSDYCFAHHPDLAEQRREARVRGGKNRRVKSPEGMRVETVGDVMGVLNLALDMIFKDGDVGSARGVGYLANVMLAALESGQLEERIKALEVEIKKLGG